MQESNDDPLAELRREYLDRAKVRAASLRRATARLVAQPDDGEALETLAFEAHKLVGSGLTFGFPILSEIGESIESLMGDSDLERLTRCLDLLDSALEHTGTKHHDALQRELRKIKS